MADWFWGKYKTILYLSVVYAIGNVALATFVNNEALFLSSLMLIAVGAGGIKPCVSANVGDQFDESNAHLINKAFNAFYASINFGSLLSILLIPYLNSHYGPRVAFGVPAIAMCIATAFFYAGRKQYVRKPPKGDENKKVIFATAFGTLVLSYLIFDRFSADIFGKGFQGGTGPILGAWGIMILIVAAVFKKQWFAKPGNFVGISLFALFNGGFKAAEATYGAEVTAGIRSVWRVLAVFAFIPIFWALWDQSQSEWVIQAKKCNLNLGFWGLKWEAEQLSAVNAVFVLILIPIFNMGIFPLVKKLGFEATPLRKIGAGLVLAALSFVVIANLQQPIDALMAQAKASGVTYESLSNDLKPSIYWQALAFFILTASEVLVSITCLEYAYTQSPPSMKSTIMACYLLSVTFGNVLVSVIQNNIKSGGFFAQFEGASFFWLFTGICAVTSVLFMVVSPHIKEDKYIG